MSECGLLFTLISFAGGFAVDAARRGFCATTTATTAAAGGRARGPHHEPLPAGRRGGQRGEDGAVAPERARPGAATAAGRRLTLPRLPGDVPVRKRSGWRLESHSFRIGAPSADELEWCFPWAAQQLSPLSVIARGDPDCRITVNPPT